MSVQNHLKNVIIFRITEQQAFYSIFRAFLNINLADLILKFVFYFTKITIMGNIKSKKITDWSLVPLFLLTLWSGIELHVTDYFTNHDHWHAWAVTHSIAGVLMAVFVILHVCQHWKWYKALGKPLKARKARVRRRAVLTLTALFAIVIITGLWVLVFVDGADSHPGLVHFVLGLAASLFAFGHIIKRYKQLLHN